MKGYKIINTIKRKINGWKNIPFITYTMLIITIIMYIQMSLNGGSENPYTLLIFGAKVNELIFLGEWWRLLTPVFLHIGFSHLLYNIVVIYFLGAELENIIGHIRYLILYLLSALLGNVTSFALNTSISAGASTAIFGLFSSTIVLAKLYPYHGQIQRLSRNYLVLIILNIFAGFMSSTVDNAGHIGGMLGGYLIMYALSAPNASSNPIKKRVKYGLIYILSIIIFILIGYFKLK